MNPTPDHVFRKTLEDIRLSFDFLFARKFKLVSVLFGNRTGTWQVTLQANKYLVELYNEQGIINLAVGVILTSGDARHFDLEYLAQFMGEGGGFSYRSQRLPLDETEQIQQIARYVEKNFSLLLAQVEKETLPKVTGNIQNSSRTGKPSQH